MKLIFLLSILTIAPSCLTAVTVYDEFSDGDLSGSFNSPSSISLNLGSNTVFGDVGNNVNSGAVDGSGTSVSRDADFFTITINPGTELTGVNVEDYSTTGPAGSVSFIGYTVGNAFAGQTFGDLTGNTLFDGALVTDPITGLRFRNLLSDPDPNDSISRPSLAGGTLSSGTYTFWLQETGNVDVNYELDLVVSAIPEASSSALFLFSTLALIAPRRR